MDQDEIEQEAKLLIMEIMMVLYKYNIKEVHMGALMRLIGVSDEKAQESDQDRMMLDESFTKYISEMVDLSEAKNHNQTLH